METMAVPAAALATAVNVSVLETWPDATVAGENEPVTPVGSPDAARFTEPVNEPVRVTATVTALVPFCATDTVAALAATVNPPAGGGFVVPPPSSSPPPPPHPHPATTTSESTTNRHARGAVLVDAKVMHVSRTE